MFRKTKKFIRDHETEFKIGAGFVGGIAATLYCIKPCPGPIVLAHLSLEPSNAAEFPLVLGKEAFEALVNDETNFIRFTSDFHPYVFRVALEQ
jgi:hypothetical protein